MDLEEELTRLRARVNILEARELVSATMADYLRRVDMQEDIDTIGELFTGAAVWEAQGNLAEFGITHGREAIAAMFGELPGTLPFTAHFVTNPTITVDDDALRANGTWHTLELCSTEESNSQLVMLAWYDNDFRFEDGRWRLDHVRFSDTRVFDYGVGWIHTRYLSPLTRHHTAT